MYMNVALPENETHGAEHGQNIALVIAISASANLGFDKRRILSDLHG